MWRLQLEHQLTPPFLSFFREMKPVSPWRCAHIVSILNICLFQLYRAQGCVKWCLWWKRILSSGNFIYALIVFVILFFMHFHVGVSMFVKLWRCHIGIQLLLCSWLCLHDVSSWPFRRGRRTEDMTPTPHCTLWCKWHLSHHEVVG